MGFLAHICQNVAQGVAYDYVWLVWMLILIENVMSLQQKYEFN